MAGVQPSGAHFQGGGGEARVTRRCGGGERLPLCIECISPSKMSPSNQRPGCQIQGEGKLRETGGGVGDRQFGGGYAKLAQEAPAVLGFGAGGAGETGLGAGGAEDVAVGFEFARSHPPVERSLGCGMDTPLFGMDVGGYVPAGRHSFVNAWVLSRLP